MSQDKNDKSEVRLSSIITYITLSIAIPVAFFVAGFFIVIFVVTTYCKLTGASPDWYLTQAFVCYIILGIASIVILLCEIVAAVQIYKRDESTIPFIGGFAKKILRKFI